VNENGRFLQMSLNVITNETAKVPKAHKESVPAWASYFKWIASNGDLNRNGYIIRPSAWKKSLANFVENWTVLYQHDPEKPIGKPLSAKVVKDELIVEGFVYDDSYSEGNIGRGLVTGLSTWHISEAVEYQHKDTGNVISEDEFDELLSKAETFGEWLDILYSYILVVTEADLVEFSFVTLPSNKGSKITQKNAVLARLWVDSEESLQSKFNEMKNVTKKVEANETVDGEVEVKEEIKEEEKVEEKEEETVEEDKVEEKTEEEVEKNEVEEEKVEETEEVSTDEETPVEKEEEVSTDEEEKEEDEKEEDKKEEEEEVETDEEAEEEEETPEKDGETPSTEEEASENDEETPAEDLSKDNNNVKFDEMKTEFNEIKTNFTSTDSRIEALENSLKNKDSQIEELTNALKEVINVVALNKSNLGSLIVNGVSSFVEKNKEDARPKSTLTNALEQFKS